MADIAYRFALYDAVTAFFLAMALAGRSRANGQSPLAAFVLGCMTAALWPLGRECLLHGSPLAVFSAQGLQLAWVLGGGCGVFVSRFLLVFERFLALSETIAMSCAASFGVLCFLPRTDPCGALLCAFFLMPLSFVVCDVAVGDEARLLTETSRFFRSLLGGIVCAAIVLYGPVFFPAAPLDGFALGCGVFLPLCLQGIFGRKPW
ncbi:MAG: hypothetical protein IJS54_03890 [Desulfovibrio sp.]|nr:hypothetical protein [Desulfovibrio sp.]